MKIAMLEPTWSIGRGGTTWTRLVAKALDADHVLWGTPPKMIRENYGGLDDCVVLRGNNERRAAILNEYDMVLLVSLRNVGKSMSREYEVMLKLKKPWTFMVHGQHESRKAPFIEELTAHEHFTGKVPTTVASYVESFYDKYSLELDPVVLPYLPYERIFDNEVREGVDIVSTGSLSANKGAYPLIVAAAGLGRDVRLRGWGFQRQFGSEPAALREKVVKRFELGLEVDPYSGDPWHLQLPSGEVVLYEGPYETVEEGLYGAAAHVNLTSSNYCWGHLEYTTLEAMDYGLPVVVPEAHLPEDPPYHLWSVADYERPAKYDEAVLRSVLAAALGMGESAKAAMVSLNRAALEEVHSPAKYAQQLLEGLGYA